MQVRLPDRVAVNWEKEREETGERSTWSSWDGGTNERPHSLSSMLTTGCREREKERRCYICTCTYAAKYMFSSYTMYIHVQVSQYDAGVCGGTVP